MNKKVFAGAAALAGIGVAAGNAVCQRAAAAHTDGTGQTVLITGGSGGIGLELAKLFAAHHFDLVLAARSADKLQAAAAELQNIYGARVQTVVADLSAPDGAEALYRELCRREITLDQFVNNAGAGTVGRLVNVAPEKLQELMNLNVVSYTLLNRYIGGDMVRRGSGRILNVASLSGYLPDPGLNVYGPTKAYERYMSEAMYGELLGSGVTVSVLCPGPVRTNWSANAGRKDSIVSMQPRSVAKAAFDGMQSGHLIIVPGVPFKALRHGALLLPTKVRVRLLSLFQKSLKKEG